jgi:predicted membrane-bound spermidine synthase
MSVPGRRDTGLAVVVVGVFFTSGFAALLYQVIWQRVLALFSGADVFSVTIIVAAFMGGLGCGNLAGGHLADRVSRTTCLLLFAGAELAIAAFALVSRPLYYDVLYASVGDRMLPTLAVGTMLFVSLLWPTFFMGLSLPLLARGLTTAIEDAARVIGSLYGWNTLGAAVGAFATPWLLLRHFDFETCLWIGAGMNAACAVVVLAIRKRASDAEARNAPTPLASAPSGTAPIFGLGAWLTIYALSGAIALSLEIAWFRVLGVIMKSTSFTFGTLLGVYLSGIAIGSIIGSYAASRRDANPVARFLWLQTGVTVYATAALAALLWLIDSDAERMPSLVRFLRSLEPLPIDVALIGLANDPLGWISPDDGYDRYARMFLLLYVAIPVLLIGPPTFAMGLSFPWLQRAIQSDARWIGRRVGWLQTANIAGSLVGSLITGFVMLPLMGSSGTFRSLTLAAATFPLLALGASFRIALTRTGPAIGLAVLAAAALSLPAGSSFWAALHGIGPRQILIEEDASGVSALVPLTGAPERSLTAGGAEVSTLPFGGYEGMHTLLGAIPVLLHPSPKRVAVIGLGSGDTLYAAASRPQAEEVVGIEIIGSQLDLLRHFQSLGGDPGLGALFAHPRTRIRISDGRTFVRRDPVPYDVIQADALRPTAAYSGNLYSLEYFRQIGASLAPDGMAVTWMPTERVKRTLLHAYPHVLMLGSIGIGSSVPIPFERRTLERAAGNPEVRAHFRAAGIDIEALLTRHLDAGPILVFDPSDPRPDGDINSDLFPRDEFLVNPR